MVLTGGNSGIGVETAKALAGAGADVLITSRDVAAGEAVAQAIAQGGARGKASGAGLRGRQGVARLPRCWVKRAWCVLKTCLTRVKCRGEKPA